MVRLKKLKVEEESLSERIRLGKVAPEDVPGTAEWILTHPSPKPTGLDDRAARINLWIRRRAKKLGDEDRKFYGEEGRW